MTFVIPDALRPAASACIIMYRQKLAALAAALLRMAVLDGLSACACRRAVALLPLN